MGETRRREMANAEVGTLRDSQGRHFAEVGTLRDSQGRHFVYVAILGAPMITMTPAEARDFQLLLVKAADTAAEANAS